VRLTKYRYCDQVEEDQTGRACSTHEMRSAYKILVEKPGGKRQLGKPRRTWENILEWMLRETGWEDVDWVHLAQDRDRWWAFVNASCS